MNTTTAHAHAFITNAVLFTKTMLSLEGDPSVLERRPSEPLPVPGEHGGDGYADKHFSACELRGREN